MEKPWQDLGSDTWRIRGLLREAECQSVAIQKQLKRFQPASGSQDRGVIDGPVSLAQSIEQLARYGQGATAEEAVDIAFLIEELFSILESEVDNLLII